MTGSHEVVGSIPIGSIRLRAFDATAERATLLGEGECPAGALAKADMPLASAHPA